MVVPQPRQPTPPAASTPPPEPLLPQHAGDAAAVAGTLATAPVVVGSVGAVAAVAQATTAALDALKAFAKKRSDDDLLLIQHTLTKQGLTGQVYDATLARILGREQGYEDEFQRKVFARVAKDLPKALRIADPTDRANAVQAILDREKQYMGMRQAALEARVVADLDMDRLQVRSPQGGYWSLGANVKKHTKDCLLLADHIYPWEVLREIYPPTHTHPGCACYILPFDSAIYGGLMTPEQIPDDHAQWIKDSVERYRQARKVAEALSTETLDLIIEEARRGYYDVRHGKRSVKGGKFKRRGEGDIESLARSLVGDTRALADTKRGRWAWADGRRIFVPEARKLDRSFGGARFTSPAGSTALYRNGVLVPDGKDDTRVVGRMDLPTVKATPTPGVTDALDDLRVAPPAKPSPKNPAGKLLAHSPDTFKEYQQESFALSDFLAARFGAPHEIRSLTQDPNATDHSGVTDWVGNITVGNETRSSIERDAKLRKADAAFSYNDLRQTFGAYKVQAHEVSHTVNVADQAAYSMPGGRVLEEGLTEEVAHVLAVENLRRHGRTDVLRWYRSNPNDEKVSGSYASYRAAISRILDLAHVPPEDREQVVLDLKFKVAPAKRTEALLGLNDVYGGTLTQDALDHCLSLADAPETPWRFVPHILAPHDQDISVRRTTVTVNGKEVGEGSRVNFRQTGRFGFAHDVAGTVVQVHPLRDGNYSLWVADDNGQVHYAVTPDRITDVVSPPRPTQVLDNGQVIAEGDQVTYTNFDGTTRTGTVTHIQQASPVWVMEVTLDEKGNDRWGGQTVVLTPTSISKLTDTTTPAVSEPALPDTPERTDRRVAPARGPPLPGRQDPGTPADRDARGRQLAQIRSAARNAADALRFQPGEGSRQARDNKVVYEWVPGKADDLRAYSLFRSSGKEWRVREAATIGDTVHLKVVDSSYTLREPLDMTFPVGTPVEVQHALPGTQDYLYKMAKRAGFDPTGTRDKGNAIEEFNGMVANTLRDLTRPESGAKVNVRVPAENIDAILSRGVLNAHSKEANGSERITRDGYLKHREEFERHVFSIPEDATAEDFPIYGYMGTDKEDLDGSIPGAFGNAKLVLRDSVRPRTTMTYSDSMFTSGPESDSVPVPLDDPRPRAVPSWMLADFADGALTKLTNEHGVKAAEPPPLTPQERHQRSFAANMETWDAERLTRLEDEGLYHRWPFGDFFEAQVHGGIAPDDIERIDFPADTPPTEAQIERMQALGIPWTTGGPLAEARPLAKADPGTIATGKIVYSEDSAREAFRLAGVGLSDASLSKTPSAGYELRSPRGALIASVNTSGYVTVGGKSDPGTAKKPWEMSLDEFAAIDWDTSRGGLSLTPAYVLGDPSAKTDRRTLRDVAINGDKWEKAEVVGSPYVNSPGFEQVLGARDMPSLAADEPMTVYRAVDPEHSGAILPGAYVTESREYARLHGEGPMNGRYHLETLQVRPSELVTYGDPHEFLYFPPDATTAHRRVIEKALADGRVVPPEVLSAYPDLALRAAQTKHDPGTGGKVLTPDEAEAWLGTLPTDYEVFRGWHGSPAIEQIKREGLEPSPTKGDIWLSLSYGEASRYGHDANRVVPVVGRVHPIEFGPASQAITSPSPPGTEAFRLKLLAAGYNAIWHHDGMNLEVLDPEALRVVVGPGAPGPKRDPGTAVPKLDYTALFKAYYPITRTPEQKAALVAYHTDGSDEINAPLRDGTTPSPQAQAQIDALDSLLATKPLPGPLTVYRGTTLRLELPDVKAGEDITVPGFMSTSIDQTATHRFGSGDKLILHLPAGVPAYFIGDDSANEQELLLGRGLTMHIDRVGNGEVEATVQAPSYADAVQTATDLSAPWRQSLEAWTGESGLDGLEGDAFSARFAEVQERQRVWRRSADLAVSRGELDPETAYARGLYREYPWSPLPDRLYHVTTAKRAVMRDGTLKSRDELDMGRGTGLGGGASDTVSFTTSPETAQTIKDSMLLARSVARGDTSLSDLVEMARRGDGAPRPYLSDMIANWGGNNAEGTIWRDGDSFPPGMQLVLNERTRVGRWGSSEDGLKFPANAETIRAHGMEPDGKAMENGLYFAATRPMTDQEKAEHRLDFLKVFLAYREHAGGPMDPLFFGSDPVAIANMDPEDVGVVEVAPVPNSMGMNLDPSGGTLGEWRTKTGSITPIVAVDGEPFDHPDVAVPERLLGKADPGTNWFVDEDRLDGPALGFKPDTRGYGGRGLVDEHGNMLTWNLDANYAPFHDDLLPEFKMRYPEGDRAYRFDIEPDGSTRSWGRGYGLDAPQAIRDQVNATLGGKADPGSDPHTTILPVVYHATDTPQGGLDLKPGGSRWGHGGIYVTTEPQRTPAMSRGRVVALPGPFKVYEVQDDNTGSAHIWQGAGDDQAFNDLLFQTAKEVGLPAKPGLGFWDQGGQLRLKPGTTDQYESNPDFKAWVDYGAPLQAALADKLKAQGYDGIWVGGEVVLWNYDKLGGKRDPGTTPSGYRLRSTYANPDAWLPEPEAQALSAVLGGNRPDTAALDAATRHRPLPRDAQVVTTGQKLDDLKPGDTRVLTGPMDTTTNGRVIPDGSDMLILDVPAGTPAVAGQGRGWRVILGSGATVQIDSVGMVGSQRVVHGHVLPGKAALPEKANDGLEAKRDPGTGARVVSRVDAEAWMAEAPEGSYTATAYHGTKDQPRLAAIMQAGLKPGYVGDVIFLTTDPHEATGYALDHKDLVVPAAVRLDKPFLIDGSKSIDLDTLRRERGIQGGVLHKAVRDAGYDGIVIHYPEDKRDPSDPYPERDIIQALTPDAVRVIDFEKLDPGTVPMTDTGIYIGSAPQGSTPAARPTETAYHVTTDPDALVEDGVIRAGDHVSLTTDARVAQDLSDTTPGSAVVAVPPDALGYGQPLVNYDQGREGGLSEVRVYGDVPISLDRGKADPGTGEAVYHVAPRTARDSIRRNGLDPVYTPNDRTADPNRTTDAENEEDNPRAPGVWVFSSRSDAENWAREMEPSYGAQDIWQANAPAGLAPDPLASTENGYYSSGPIPAAHLRLLDGKEDPGTGTITSPRVNVAALARFRDKDPTPEPYIPPNEAEERGLRRLPLGLDHLTLFKNLKPGDQFAGEDGVVWEVKGVGSQSGWATAPGQGNRQQNFSLNRQVRYLLRSGEKPVPAPPTPPYVAPDTREPWQMTLDEFAADPKTWWHGTRYDAIGQSPTTPLVHVGDWLTAKDAVVGRSRVEGGTDFNMIPVRVVGPLSPDIGVDFVGDPKEPGVMAPEIRMKAMLKRGVKLRQGYKYRNEGEGVREVRGRLVDPISVVVPNATWLKTHEDFVREALADGKPVPPEVLKDYMPEGKADPGTRPAHEEDLLNAVHTLNGNPARRYLDSIPPTQQAIELDLRGRAAEMAEKLSTPSDLSRIQWQGGAFNDHLIDHNGEHSQETGTVGFGPEVLTSLLQAQHARDIGRVLTPDEAMYAWLSYEVMQHEIGHSLNPTSKDESYSGWRKVLLEGINEEVAPVLTADWLRSQGFIEPLTWLKAHPEHFHAKGTYQGFRQRIKDLLDEAKVPEADREALLMRWKFHTSLTGVRDELAAMLPKPDVRATLQSMEPGGGRQRIGKVEVTRSGTDSSKWWVDGKKLDLDGAVGALGDADARVTHVEQVLNPTNSAPLKLDDFEPIIRPKLDDIPDTLPVQTHEINGHSFTIGDQVEATDEDGKTWRGEITAITPAASSPITVFRHLPNTNDPEVANDPAYDGPINPRSFADEKLVPAPATFMRDGETHTLRIGDEVYDSLGRLTKVTGIVNDDKLGDRVITDLAKDRPAAGFWKPGEKVTTPDGKTLVIGHKYVLGPNLSGTRDPYTLVGAGVEFSFHEPTRNNTTLATPAQVVGQVTPMGATAEWEPGDPLPDGISVSDILDQIVAANKPTTIDIEHAPEYGNPARYKPTKYTPAIAKIKTAADANAYLKRRGLGQSDLTVPEDAPQPTADWYRQVVQAIADGIKAHPEVTKAKVHPFGGVRVMKRGDMALGDTPETAWAYTGPDPRTSTATLYYDTAGDGHAAGDAKGGSVFIGINPYGEPFTEEMDVTSFASVATGSIYGRTMHEFGHALAEAKDVAVAENIYNVDEDPITTLFVNAGVSPRDVALVSPYGANNAAEGFAELYAMMNTPNALDDAGPTTTKNIREMADKLNKAAGMKLL